MTKLRIEVLRLYKQIITISRTWESVNLSDLTTERNYIKTEARRLFKKNKNVSYKKQTGIFMSDSRGYRFK